ncbi:decaprenylphospho-beta-D-erythro-pentofuranosid-2-ulose 2-reductase [Streptomyces sp. NPDC002889]|uniref:decaprenylphospho-beta-D-erythro-pentofuranosid- 2-ulose 2-reductase n=1 Tax=Streptomyces sp. NPDC002889 TaxID=3364669 RepID=UPI0036CA755E
MKDTHGIDPAGIPKFLPQFLPQPVPQPVTQSQPVPRATPRSTPRALPRSLPQSLLVLGGTSEIGLAVARRLITRRTRTVWLAGRPSPGLEAAAAHLRTLGAEVRIAEFDALDCDTHEETLGKIFAEGGIDMVLLAFGVPGDQARDEADPPAAVRVAQTNYTGAVSAGLVCAGALEHQGYGSLVVLSSVAGERARRADFIYGSSKAGLDAFAQGLGDALEGTGVRVMVVRPGSVRTAKTAGTAQAPLSTTPEQVALAVELGLRRGSETVWVPGVLRVVMSALRHLPRALFRRLPV